MSVKKSLYVKSTAQKEKAFVELNSNSVVQVADLIRVRLEISSDRSMEFIHLKDMRASGLEPINVFSGHRRQMGVTYYESTRDEETNFFIDRLPKGTFIIEYDLRVNNAGDMSNGISTIQSMYAPEFSSHSEGIRVSVD